MVQKVTEKASSSVGFAAELVCSGHDHVTWRSTVYSNHHWVSTVDYALANLLVGGSPGEFRYQLAFMGIKAPHVPSWMLAIILEEIGAEYQRSLVAVRASVLSTIMQSKRISINVDGQHSRSQRNNLAEGKSNAPYCVVSALVMNDDMGVVVAQDFVSRDEVEERRQKPVASNYVLLENLGLIGTLETIRDKLLVLKDGDDTIAFEMTCDGMSAANNIAHGIFESDPGVAVEVKRDFWHACFKLPSQLRGYYKAADQTWGEVDESVCQEMVATFTAICLGHRKTDPDAALEAWMEFRNCARRRLEITRAGSSGPFLKFTDAKDLEFWKRFTGVNHTYTVECFHSTNNLHVPKGHTFPFKTYVARLQSSTMEWNAKRSHLASLQDYAKQIRARCLERILSHPSDDT
jgi:hypothetical protein